MNYLLPNYFLLLGKLFPFYHIFTISLGTFFWKFPHCSTHSDCLQRLMIIFLLIYCMLLLRKFANKLKWELDKLCEPCTLYYLSLILFMAVLKVHGCNMRIFDSCLDFVPLCHSSLCIIFYNKHDARRDYKQLEEMHDRIH